MKYQDFGETYQFGNPTKDSTKLSSLSISSTRVGAINNGDVSKALIHGFCSYCSTHSSESLPSVSGDRIEAKKEKIVLMLVESKRSANFLCILCFSRCLIVA